MLCSANEVAARISAERAVTDPNRAFIAGISGIDGSGKGLITAEIGCELRKQSLIVAVIAADGWLNLPSVRFNDLDPGRHFYENGFRLDQMFENVVGPLRTNRMLNCEVHHVAETASAFHKHAYHLDAVDVVLVEGIFLFKPEYRRHFDLKIWINCSFETALERAVRRSQEGLSAEETVAAYENIYFPAQRIHLERDKPIEAASLVLTNDPRL